MNYAQPPYAQPPYGFAQPTGVAAIDPTGHHPGVRIWLLLTGIVSGSFYVGGLVALLAAMLLDDKDLTPILLIAGWAVMMLGGILIYVKIGLALYWLNGAWKWVPMDRRFGRDGKRFAPGDTFMLLIPYYNFYWMFPINLGLCDAMEAMRSQMVQAPRVDPPPRDTAMWAAICELIPFVSFFVAPFLWSSYMRRIDAMHDEIMNAMASRG